MKGTLYITNLSVERKTTEKVVGSIEFSMSQTYGLGLAIKVFFTEDPNRDPILLYNCSITSIGMMHSNYIDFVGIQYADGYYRPYKVLLEIT